MAASASLGCTYEGPSCAVRPAFTSTGPRIRSAAISRDCRICLCLPLLASPVSVLVTELLLKGLLEDLGGVDTWISCGGEVPFWFQERWWVFPNTSESVLDYLPQFDRAEPLVGKWVGPLELVCWKPGGVSIGSLLRGKHQSGVLGKGKEGTCPKASPWHPLNLLMMLSPF